MHYSVKIGFIKQKAKNTLSLSVVYFIKFAWKKFCGYEDYTFIGNFSNVS